jgi:hypothetical protein
MNMLPKIVLTLCITGICAGHTKGFDFYRPVGARGWGMGNSTITFTDVWSTQNNQAGLGFIKNATAGTFLENRFGLSTLNYGVAAVALPTRFGTFGVNVNQFGYSAYSEQKFGLGFGRAFTDKFSFGFQMNYQHVRIAEYQRAGAISIEAGIIYKVNKQLHAAFHLSNPTLQEMPAPINQRLPVAGKMGLAYLVSEKFTFTAEGVRIMDAPVSVRTGAEYKVHPDFHVRAGFMSNPNTATFGAGYRKAGWQIDVATSIQPVLGISPHASLSYQFARKTK